MGANFLVCPLFLSDNTTFSIDGVVDWQGHGRRQLIDAMPPELTRSTSGSDDAMLGGPMKANHLVYIFWLLAAPLALAQNPIPFVNQPLVPTSAIPGGPGFTLTVNGTGYVSGATVNWNGTALVTTFVSSSQLTAAVPAANVVTASSAAVTVSNPSPGGGPSSVQYFHVATPILDGFVIYSLIGYAATNNLDGPAVIGDFNGDEKPDVVAAGPSGLICVLLGNGDGTFQNLPCSVFSGPVWSAFIAADFNGDGKLDLAAIDSVSNQVDIFLGNGDGTFQSPKIVGTPSPVSVISGDFNGDGKLDLAIGNQINSSNPTGGLSILLGNGDGTFQAPVAYSAGSSVGELAVGDFNSDGKLDIALFDGQSTSVSLLLGNGDGTFQPGIQVLSGGGFALAAADMNGDGKLDLVVGNAFPPNGVTTLSVLLGNGDGTFQPALVADTGAGPTEIEDVNADGKLGVVMLAVSPGYSSFFVSFSNGDGTFGAGGITGGAGYTPFGLTTADFNNDGLVDVGVSAGGGYAVSLEGLFPGAILNSYQAVPLNGAVNLGQQVINTTGDGINIELLNEGMGPTPLVLIGIQTVGENAAEFVVMGGYTCPLTGPAPPECFFAVQFSPTALGVQTATLTVTDNVIGSPQTAALTGTGVDFSVAAPQPTTTVTAGQTASYTIALAPLGGFSQNVALSCGGAPAGSTCSVPSNVMVAGSSPTKVTVTVTTVPMSASLIQPSGPSMGGGMLSAWLAISGLSGLVVWSGGGSRSRKGRERVFYVLAFLCILSLGVTMSACGGASGTGSSGGTGGTPAGTYNLTVKGTVTLGTITTTRATNLTLVVQ